MQIKNFIINQHLEEMTKHRTVELPIACYETTINQNIHGYIPLHWHEEIQFVLIVKGEAIFQVNEERIIVRKGEGLFINSGCLHMAQEKEHSDCVYICLNVSPHFVVPQELFATYVFPYLQATNIPYVFIGANDPWGKNISEGLINIKQLIDRKPSFFEIDITLQLMSIWKNLICYGFQPEHVETELLKSQRMKQMLNWIHAHYAENYVGGYCKSGELESF